MTLLPLLVLFLFLFSCRNEAWAAKVSPRRPAVVHVGALLTFNSTIGRVSKVAIDAAKDDINNDPSVLPGTKLDITMKDTNCSGFIGMIEALQFMETDAVAIVGPQCSTIAHIISHVANELQVPLVSFAATDPTLSSLEYPFFVRNTQSDEFQMAAIAEIIDYYTWNQIIALYIDDENGRNGISTLGDKLAERRCKISYKARLRPEASRSDINDLLGVLTLRQHTADSKMKSAFASRWSSLSMRGNIGNYHLNAYALYAYDAVWTVARAIDAFFRNGGKISFSNDTRLNDIGGSLHLEALSIFDEGQLLLDEVRRSNFAGITGTVQFDSDGNLIHPAYDVINVIGTGTRTIGYWSNYSGLSVMPPETFYSKLPNHSAANNRLYNVIWPGETTTKPRGWVFPNNGKELKIGFPNRFSYRAFISKQPGTDMAKGYCVDVFTASVNLLPYAVPFKFIPFGNGHENPNYYKLAEMVASGDFDAAIGDIAIVTNRTKLVDYTQPYIESGLVVLAPVKKQKSNAWAFLRPFTVEMWCITGFFFLIVGAVVWTLEHRMNDDFRGPPKQQIATIFWFSFSTLFFSQRENTVSTLGRAVLIIWLFVVLIIQSSYTASLTSILTVQQLSSPIKGIDSLISDDEPIGFQVGSFAENYMVEELGISRSRLKALGSPEEYARALEQGPDNGGVAAVVDERPYIELFLASQCKFAIVGSEFKKGGWGFIFPRDSPLAVDMSTAILALSENGDLQRIHDKWLAPSACSSQTDEIDSSRLQLNSFWGLFLICGLACFLALLIYFFLVLQKYVRHASSGETDSSSQQLSSRHSIQRFFSFIDDKEEGSRNKSKKKQMQRPTSNDTTDDIEIKENS